LPNADGIALGKVGYWGSWQEIRVTHVGTMPLGFEVRKSNYEVLRCKNRSIQRLMPELRQKYIHVNVYVIKLTIQ
jgi:hypothetical protein